MRMEVGGRVGLEHVREELGSAFYRQERRRMSPLGDRGDGAANQGRGAGFPAAGR